MTINNQSRDAPESGREGVPIELRGAMLPVWNCERNLIKDIPMFSPLRGGIRFP